MQYGYSFKSKNNYCSIYMNKTFNGHTLNINGLLDLDSSDTHIHSIEAKRYKFNNDNTTYLWLCRLGHIGVKRMKKHHANGLLESLDACEPCLMGKMTKTLFFGTMERATYLLEIIHTNVCGPMNIEARGGYRYFLTFTDDFKQIWVYLLDET